MLKILILLTILGIGHFSLASSKIICADEGSLENYSTSSLKEFGNFPEDLSPPYLEKLSKSVCDFPGIFRESWFATCFLKKEIENLPSGSRIQGLMMSGFEHGKLTATEVKDLNCQVL